MEVTFFNYTLKLHTPNAQLCLNGGMFRKKQDFSNTLGNQFF